MYRPRHFAVDDLEKVAAFVDQVGAADIVTFDSARPIASLIPVIWERPERGEGPDDGPGLGRLLGHIALANRQWETSDPDAEALAIVHGPQAYISPSWYATKAEHGRVVPTWNYRTVHFTGRISFHRDADRLREIVTRLTDRHESARAHRWYVDDAPAAYVEAQLRGIVGVELLINTIEAKDKLSQNRSTADRLGAVAGLRHEGQPHADAVADLMQATLTD